MTEKSKDFSPLGVGVTSYKSQAITVEPAGIFHWKNWSR